MTMISAIHAFRAQLVSGKLCLGASITFSDPTVTEALCDSSDFIWIDTEHKLMNLDSISGHLIAARACNTASLVRVPTSATGYIKNIVDAGATGIIVPQVRSADEVKHVVDACRYPPMGDRGFGPHRASNYGRDMHDLDAYVEKMNKDLFVSVQIEHMEAYSELDDIVAIPGLDSIVIGPMDLSASMGLLGQMEHPDVIGAMEHIIDVGHRAGLYIGMGMGTDVDFAQTWDRKGVDWIQVGCDYSYMIQELDRTTQAIRHT
jgi:2-dehydro-3-deoxyglucarate aldolase